MYSIPGLVDHHYFYPRPPRGGRRNTAYQRAVTDIFLSTPSARRATAQYSAVYVDVTISIHALREEGDMGLIPPFCTMSHFYPRPPRGGRPEITAAVSSASVFLSTPSARRATPVYVPANVVFQISIHALREEGDPSTTAWCSWAFYFYPRPPRGGRHHAAFAGTLPPGISIHALREEGDIKGMDMDGMPHDFYPRPPRGGRRRCSTRLLSQAHFYPRPPRGGRRTSLWPYLR